jgi:hypothetical protein
MKKARTAHPLWHQLCVALAIPSQEGRCRLVALGFFLSTACPSGASVPLWRASHIYKIYRTESEMELMKQVRKAHPFWHQQCGALAIPSLEGRCNLLLLKFYFQHEMPLSARQMSVTSKHLCRSLTCLYPCCSAFSSRVAVQHLQWRTYIAGFATRQQNDFAG